MQHAAVELARTALGMVRILLVRLEHCGMAVSATEEADDSSEPQDWTDLPVKSNSNLMPCEREFYFRNSEDSDGIHVFCEIATVARNLIKNNNFTTNEVVIDNGDFSQTVSVDDVPDSATVIYGVGGTMPIGCLKVQPNSRSSNNYTDIVSRN